jgi:tetratricopeptide (TPR) repeat protein
MTETNLKDFIKAASYLAVQGNFKAATSILDKLQGKERSVEVLVLRGKIAAQQKNYEQATGYFNDALDLEPENIEAKEGKHTAQQILSNPAGRFLFSIRPYIPAAIIVVLLLAVVIMAGKIQGGNGNVQSLLENHDKVITQLADTVTALKDNTSAAEQRISLLEKQLAETENKSVSTAKNIFEEQLSGAIEGLKTDYNQKISTVQVNLVTVMTLSRDVQRLRKEWSKIESKLFGPNKKERDQMLQELTKLEEKTDALLKAMNTDQSNPASNTSTK